MRASELMFRFNPNAFRGLEGGGHVYIEDHTDENGDMWRLEYRTDPDGRVARAFVLHNPWGANPFSPQQSHLHSTGEICLAGGDLPLETAVPRARYFCTAYSFFREHGEFPDPT